MGGGAWDSLGRIGKRDCSVDDDDVKKPDCCSAPTFSCKWDRRLEPGLASFIGRITTASGASPMKRALPSQESAQSPPPELE
jgi:hypothetical protein